MKVTLTQNNETTVHDFDTIDEAESFIFQRQNEPNFKLAMLHYQLGVCDIYQPLEKYEFAPNVVQETI